MKLAILKNHICMIPFTYIEAHKHGIFSCCPSWLPNKISSLENIETAWTNQFALNQEITIPLKNGEGGYIATQEELARLEGEGLVVFRYLDVNPNGSMNDIAGLRNERGNVVGLMPHPEHAVEPGFGPDTSVAMRSGVDGLLFFKSVLNALVNA